MGEKLSVSREQLLEEKDSMYIWYDYVSVPQIDNSKELAPQVSELTKAVRSIPYYVEQADYFLVLSPTIQHKDFSCPMSFHTWGSRGWCRMELLSRLLAVNSGPVICLKTPVEVDLLPMYDAEYRYSSVGRANFTVDKDREFIGDCMQTLVSNKLRAVRSDLAIFRYYSAMFGTYLDGCPTSAPLQETADEFLKDYRFEGTGEDPSGWTALRYSIIAGNVPVARELLARGADPNLALAEADGALVRPQQFSMLHEAAQARNGAELLQMLLEAQADPATKDGGGHTPLHAAAKAGKLEATTFLLDRGFEHLPAAYQNTPLHLSAVYSGDPDVLHELVKRGADPRGLNIFGAWPMHKAAMHGNDCGIDVMMQHTPECVNTGKVAPDPMGEYLHTTHELRYHFGERSDQVTLFGQNALGTPLHDAARHGFTSIVARLLEQKADPTLRGRAGWTALQLARDNRHVHAAELLAQVAPEEATAEEAIKAAWPATEDVYRQAFGGLPDNLQGLLLTDCAPYVPKAPESIEDVLAAIRARYGQ